ncbi:hypothetical protein CRUP_023718 [Coryphaenoides rupestris]|nr:hypothetical protein CRUP_023718 [Coryphaenoides rupestris]
MQDAGVALVRAFHYIAHEVDSEGAFEALISRFPYVEVGSILGVDSSYDATRKEGRGYYEQTGVGPLPVVMYNGMPFQPEQLDPEELETATMHKILETTSLFQRAVYVYELEYLLLEGHCFDVSTGQPPRGLQFTLGTASQPVIMDTIVMANLVSDTPPP